MHPKIGNLSAAGVAIARFGSEEVIDERPEKGDRRRRMRFFA
jgi:hypothetical protein